MVRTVVHGTSFSSGAKLALPLRFVHMRQGSALIDVLAWLVAHGCRPGEWLDVDLTWAGFYRDRRMPCGRDAVA